MRVLAVYPIGIMFSKCTRAQNCAVVYLRLLLKLKYVFVTNVIEAESAIGYNIHSYQHLNGQVRHHAYSNIPYKALA